MLLNSILLTGILLISCGNQEETTEEDATETNEITSDSTEVETSEEDTLATVDDQSADEGCPCNFDAYRTDPDEFTNIRNSPNGEVVLKLDEKDENFAFFTLIDAKDGWFKLANPIETMEGSTAIPGGEGWIHNSVIGFDTRNYANQPIQIFAQPNKEAEVVSTINEETVFTPLSACGDFVKIKYKGVIGWIHNEWVCGNALTTCS